MLAVQRKDDFAFSLLVDRHVDKLYSYIFRLSKNPNDTDDLVQEAFIAVWEGSKSYNTGRAKFTTWLFRIAHNKFIDQLRKKREIRPKYEELDRQKATSIGQKYENAITKEAVNQALNELPENQKSAIALNHIQDFSNGQISNILGVSVSAVESLLSRARKTLRAKLKGESV